MVIIIEGAGEVGSHLAKMLSNEANDITVIDIDEERLARLSMTADIVTILGDLSCIFVVRKGQIRIRRSRRRISRLFRLPVLPRQTDENA